MLPTMDRVAAEAAFRRNSDAIDRISATLCHRHELSGRDAEEFASLVRQRFAQDDYAILRKFRDDETLLSHLLVVSGVLLREYRVTRLGGRRPSAAIRPPGVGLAQALDALPAPDRTLVQMHLLEGMSVSDIAQALGENEATLHQRIDGLVARIRLSGETQAVGEERH